MTQPNNELTKEKILAMESGRELDALIAEKVMGWSIYHYDKDVPERCYYMLVDDKFEVVADDKPWSLRNGERKTEEEAWKDNRQWSSDISVAFEALKATKRIVHLEGHFHTGWSVVLDGKYTATEWDLPIAICKAALLAVMDL